MELTKEFVENCNKPSILREFLLQAMERVDSMEKELASLREATRWRKFSDEKPSKEDYYIICGSSGFRNADKWTHINHKGLLVFMIMAYSIGCPYSLHQRKNDTLTV